MPPQTTHWGSSYYHIIVSAPYIVGLTPACGWCGRQGGSFLQPLMSEACPGDLQGHSCHGQAPRDQGGRDVLPLLSVQVKGRWGAAGSWSRRGGTEMP